MFGSVVLEIAIGLAYLYLLLSVICSALNEWLASFLQLRANTLRSGLANVLAPSAVDKIYSNPLVQNLTGTSRPPSYIPARVFATALLDAADLSGKLTSTTTLADAQAAIDAVHDEKLRKMLSLLLIQAGQDVVQLRTEIESWFNDTMDRLSGWYKRRVQWIIFGIAVTVVGVLNVDTVMIVNWLAQAPGRAAQLAVLAQRQVQPPQGVSQPPSQALAALQIPLGWLPPTAPSDPRSMPTDRGDWFSKLIGLFFTAIAVSMGAPFWFDFLGRLVNLRASGDPPAAVGSGQPQRILLQSAIPVPGTMAAVTPGVAGDGH